MPVDFCIGSYRHEPKPVRRPLVLLFSVDCNVCCSEGAMFGCCCDTDLAGWNYAYRSDMVIFMRNLFYNPIISKDYSTLLQYSYYAVQILCWQMDGFLIILQSIHLIFLR